MRLVDLLESTHGDRPGFADAANDCLVQAAEPENAEEWLVAAMVFATLAVAEELRRLIDVANSIDTTLQRGLA